MKKIKKKIIEWLCLSCVEEFHEVLEARYIQGKYVAYDRMLSEMEEVYGMPADEWCNNIYNFVKKELNKNVTLAQEADKGTIEGEWLEENISKYK